MARLRAFVDEHELKDIYMHGRQFTWSNEREEPTLNKNDRALASIDWELPHPDNLLHALSTSVSDHAPLLLSFGNAFNPKKRFKFELFWYKLEGFEEAAWTCDPAIHDPFKRLDGLLGNTVAYHQVWG